MPKILISSRCAWSLTNYRGGQMRALAAEGYEVVAAAAADGYESHIAEGCARFVTLPVPYRSLNPLADIRLLAAYYRLYRRERPEVVHNFTIKPVIYGTIAAKLAGVPCIVNTITGLGYVFTNGARPWLRRLVEAQYRLALSCSDHTFFQNEEDRKVFVERKLVRLADTGVVPGSGVDIEQFAPRRPVPSQSTDRPVVFLMMARLLRDKGVYEYIEAARMVNAGGKNGRFQLLGKRDEYNPSVVPLKDLQQWQREGVIEYLGDTDDVRDRLAAADVVVLPSYREGTPRSLLEAASMAKPLIATEAVGCREVVEHNLNGLLVPIQDPPALASAMVWMLDHAERRVAMGLAGREKVVREFDEQIVIRRCMAAYLTKTPRVSAVVVEPVSEV